MQCEIKVKKNYLGNAEVEHELSLCILHHSDTGCYGQFPGHSLLLVAGRFSECNMGVCGSGMDTGKKDVALT